VIAVPEAPASADDRLVWIDLEMTGLDVERHRIVELAAIVPRNAASRRVAHKLGLRDEGVAERFLQIRGVWEDHVRYAITSEEWDVRRDEITRRFLT